MPSTVDEGALRSTFHRLADLAVDEVLAEANPDDYADEQPTPEDCLLACRLLDALDGEIASQSALARVIQYEPRESASGPLKQRDVDMRVAAFGTKLARVLAAHGLVELFGVPRKVQLTARGREVARGELTVEWS